MSATIEKWAAGFWLDRLHVIKGSFKRTAKQYRHEKVSRSDDDDLDTILKWRSVFDIDTDLLHDTQEEALNALRLREVQSKEALQKDLERVQNRINLIDKFEIST